MITDDQLKNWFTYHPADQGKEHFDDSVKYVAIRNAGYDLAKIIVDATPPSADQTAAIRKVREAVMTANAAIACERK